MPTRAWFPTLIHDTPLGGRAPRAFERELLREIAVMQEIDSDGQRWSSRRYPGGYTSYASMNQLHRSSSNFAALELRLAPHIASLARALDYDLRGRRLAMTDCWVNVMPPGVTHGLHLHPLSTLSGTYYLRTPSGSPALKFEDPRLASFMAAPPRKAACRPSNRAFVYYPVSVGRVILFESWLRHEVAPNLSASERISVSFNYHW